MENSELKITIRKYTPKDYLPVQSLLYELNMFHPPMDGKLTFNRKIKRDRESILIAQKGRDIIGVIFIMDDGWESQIYRFAVKKEYQEKGIGSLLLNKAEKIFKKRKYSQIEIWVDPENRRLISFYKKRGYFAVVPRLLMVKQLGKKK